MTLAMKRNLARSQLWLQTMQVASTWIILSSSSVAWGTAMVPASKFKVAIDPGHGGSDAGAVFTQKKSRKRTTEKELTLAVALEVERQLLDLNYPVILTRRIDADMALNARTAIANRERANLFISLHVNSAPGKVSGIETFILNNTTDEKSRRLAELENKGLDPNKGSKQTQSKEVNLILKDFVLDSNLPESKRIACELQSHLTEVTHQRYRGIKQALFMVLLGADMPCALLELGFIQSDEDRKLLEDPHGVRAIATAIVRGIERFRRQKDTIAGKKTQQTCQVQTSPH